MTETEAQIVALIRSGMSTRDALKLRVGSSTITKTTQRYMPEDERRALSGKRRKKAEQRMLTHEGLNRVMAREISRRWA